ncbi:MAG: hypothetical protein EPN47_20035 [Acidobacteria bacterium]|nr:MAG: hypothetical protein EPN47_20035 [Acidobacteriota bacterium]
MATSPQPAGLPRKPLDKHVVWAILLVIGFIIASGLFMVWFGLRILSHSVQVKVSETGPDSKVVTVRTPVGNLRIAKDQNLRDPDIGLPVYPGSTRAADSNGDNSVSLNFDLPSDTDLRIVAAKFNTPDPVNKVQDFYKVQLGGEATSFSRTDREGKIVFEMKGGEQDKVVSLRPYDGGTQIHLVRIFHGHAEPN